MKYLLLSFLLLVPASIKAALPDTITDPATRDVVEYLDGKVDSALATLAASSATLGTSGGVQPISLGGTGATTASGALSNLGAPAIDGTGAVGTWPISITGTAATATNNVLKAGDTMTGPLNVLAPITANSFYGDGSNLTGIITSLPGVRYSTDSVSTALIDLSTVTAAISLKADSSALNTEITNRINGDLLNVPYDGAMHDVEIGTHAFIAGAIRGEAYPSKAPHYWIPGMGVRGYGHGETSNSDGSLVGVTKGIGVYGYAYDNSYAAGIGIYGAHENDGGPNYVNGYAGWFDGDVVSTGSVTASYFSGDGSHLTGVVTAEADPIFTASPAHGIAAGDITNWNGKVSKAGDTMTGDLINSATVQANILKSPNFLLTNSVGSTAFWKDTRDGLDGVIRMQTRTGPSTADSAANTVFSIDAPYGKTTQEATLALVTDDDLMDLFNQSYSGDTGWGLRFTNGNYYNRSSYPYDAAGEAAYRAAYPAEAAYADTQWRNFNLQTSMGYGGPAVSHLTVAMPSGKVGIDNAAPAYGLDVATNTHILGALDIDSNINMHGGTLNVSGGDANFESNKGAYLYVADAVYANELYANHFYGDGSHITGIAPGYPIYPATSTILANYGIVTSSISSPDGSIEIGPIGEAGDNANYGISIGSGTYSNHDNGVGIGYYANGNYINAVGVGYGSSNNHDFGTGVGGNTSNNHDYGTGVGNGAFNNRNFGVGVGAGASGNHDYAVGIGASSQGNGTYGAALGAFSYAASSSTALGAYAKANAVQSIAIGNSTVNNTVGTAAFGSYAITTSSNVTAAAYYGDGSHLTGVAASGGSISTVTIDALPIGTFIQYGSTTPPSSYLYCDGTSYSTTTYSALFGVIGYAYSPAAMKGTANFTCDFRGMFARGLDTSKVQDSEYRVIGSSETDTLQTHTHTIINATLGSGSAFNGGLGSGSLWGGSNWDLLSARAVNAPTDARTGSQTQPKNIAVAMMVKYTTNNIVPSGSVGYRAQNFYPYTNGANVTFTLTNIPLPNSLILTKNGVAQAVTTDYTLTSNVITMNSAPASSTTLVASYAIADSAFGILATTNTWTAAQVISSATVSNLTVTNGYISAPALGSNFCGISTSTYTGNIGGWSAVHTACNTTCGTTTGHMCTWGEVSLYFQLTGSVLGANNLWINDPDAINNNTNALCLGWTSNSSSYSVYIYAGGATYPNPYACSNSYAIACCK
jgi:hypothetical protein